MTNKDDGSLFYTGGEAYALDLDQQTLLNDFKHELAETFQCGADAMSIKYFLPGNKKTLITISKDKDLKRMVNFFKDTDQVEIFVIAEEAAARNVSNMPASRYFSDCCTLLIYLLFAFTQPLQYVCNIYEVVTSLICFHYVFGEGK